MRNDPENFLYNYSPALLVLLAPFMLLPGLVAPGACIFIRNLPATGEKVYIHEGTLEDHERLL